MSLRLSQSSRVLVIGGAGFIGSHLARVCEDAGIAFRIADLRSPKFTRADGQPLDFVRLDVRDEDALTSALDGCDAVLNLAAAHHDFGVSERTFQTVNVGGAEALTSAMERAGVENLCFYSSVAVYGEHEGAPIPTEETEPRPTNTYGRSKWAAEQIYRAWEDKAEGRRLLVLRPAVVFGPRNYANVYRMIAAIDKRRFFPVGAGTNVKSMVSVHNLLAALVQLWSSERTVTDGYEVYNYVDVPDLTSAQVMDIIYRELGRRRPPVSLPVQPALALTKPLDRIAKTTGVDLPVTSERVRKLAFAHTQFDASRVHAKVDVPTSLEAALAEMVAWYRSVKNAPVPAPSIAPERWIRQGEYSAEADNRRVVAVVVTYNREHLISECLDALAAQSHSLAGVIVVDNASTDSSGRVADEHPIGATVLHLNRNVGGAGGFTAGMAHAMLTMNPDFLWIMDDDTIPFATALEELLATESKLDVHASVLSSTAVWTDGAVHPMNSARTRLRTSAADLTRFAEAGARPIRTASFVSALIRADDVRRHGLPWADYFIWSDDFEYTGRLLKHSHGFNVDASRVEHRTATFAGAQDTPGNRLYFDVRNKIWALRSGSFSPLEAVLYGGSTALAWAKTTLRTRGSLVPIAIRGFRDAVLTAPRPSDQVLKADPARAEELRAIQRGVIRR